MKILDKRIPSYFINQADRLTANLQNISEEYPELAEDMQATIRFIATAKALGQSIKDYMNAK